MHGSRLLFIGSFQFWIYLYFRDFNICCYAAVYWRVWYHNYHSNMGFTFSCQLSFYSTKVIWWDKPCYWWVITFKIVISELSSLLLPMSWGIATPRLRVHYYLAYMCVCVSRTLHTAHLIATCCLIQQLFSFFLFLFLFESKNWFL